MSGPRLLITGIGGFTGQHLERISSLMGYSVFGITTRIVSNKNQFQCSLADTKRLLEILQAVKPDYLIHLAASSHVKKETVNSYYDVNLVGSINLLEAFRQVDQKPQHLLLVSSADVYGNNSNVCEESVTPVPVSHYGLSKAGMEGLVNIYPELPVSIARPFNYSGVGQSEEFFLPKLVGCYLRRESSIFVGDLSVYRDFSDVRDVCTAYVSILERGNVGDVYNICSGFSVQLTSLLDQCNRLSPHRPQVITDCGLQRLNEVVTKKGSNAKLCDLGWSPRYKLEDTLEWMFKRN